MKKPKSTEAERLIQAVQALIKAGKVRSFTDAAKKAGYQSQDFTDLKSGKKDLQRLFLDDLCNTLPINRDYIVTGKGEMLTDNPASQPESQPKQLEFDFNRWMENEEKKTASLQKLITTNSQLSSTNSELVEMLKEAMSKSGKGEFQNQIDELSRRIDRFLESWSQKRAEDAI